MTGFQDTKPPGTDPPRVGMWNSREKKGRKEKGKKGERGKVENQEWAEI